MSRVTRPALLFAIAAAAALALAACGSGSDAKLLPGKTAQEINENLDSVQQLVDEHECVDAADAALEVSSEVESLQNIDPELKQILQKGAARLNEVVDTCQEATEETIEETVPEPEISEEEPKKKEKKPKKVEPETTQPEEQEEEAKAPTEQKPPPQANGEAKGDEEAPPATEEEGGEPSGGIGPGTAAGEGTG
jgi:outer membrane biosynthesis protein TonB